MDISSVRDISVEVLSGSKKEKMQNSFGFFQRSCNAIMGAADAVRRVAAKGAFGDDNRRTEALVMTIDGMVWIGVQVACLCCRTGMAIVYKISIIILPLFNAFVLLVCE